MDIQPTYCLFLLVIRDWQRMRVIIMKLVLDIPFLNPPIPPSLFCPNPNPEAYMASSLLEIKLLLYTLLCMQKI